MDKYAHLPRRQPEYVAKNFFGQLKRILLLDLPPLPSLNLPGTTTIILAVIQNVKATLRGDIYYYEEQSKGVIEVVDLNTVQCLVGRIKDRRRWAIVDRSGIQVDRSSCKSLPPLSPILSDIIFLEIQYNCMLWTSLYLIFIFIICQTSTLPYLPIGLGIK